MLRLSASAACVLLTCLLAACSPDDQPPSVPLQQALGGSVHPAFLRAEKPRDFAFPRDHAPHDGFRNEWWHFNGNVATEEGQRYGFQATFFRIALTPPATAIRGRPSRWAAHQVWMAHVALTDSHRRQHFAHERFAREAMSLAGAASPPSPFKLWLGDWQVAAPCAGCPWRLRARTDDFDLDLTLSPQVSPTLQGEDGLSRKSAESGNASYYYSISRIATHGTLRLGGQAQPQTVSGLSWFDREWSSSALAPDQAGWDWFALQLQDGADLMFYRLRDHAGHTDPHSAGSIRFADLPPETLRAGDVALTPLRWWRNSGGVDYPVAWELEIAPLKRRWRVEAVVDAQEMALAVRYWEGMVVVREAGRVIGRGYLEMTGYR